MKKIRWSTLLMFIAILAVAGFQLYWLRDNYQREKQNLDIKTMASFRQTILQLQSSKLGIERYNNININIDSIHAPDIVISTKKNNRKPERFGKRKEPTINILSLLQEKLKDSIFKSLSEAAYYDSTKRVQVVTVNGNQHKTFDSIPGVKLTTSFSFTFDSLSPGPPAAANEIRMEKIQNWRDTLLAINSLKKIAMVRPDSSRPGPAFFVDLPHDDRDTNGAHQRPPGERNAVFRFLYKMDSLSLKDSVTVKEITEAYTKRLKEDHINAGFKVNRLDSAGAESPDAVTIGFSQPVSFSLSLQNTFSYMLKQLKLPVLFSLLLVGVTIFSFVLLYRNMLKQQRLAELKNEFISNITHELKTPIATVGVAIEALKNFNAIRDPQRTKEYLDISQNELQRLNLLVDKVLKLSMFEKKEIELKQEIVNLEDIVSEVMSSMKLQLEKYHAQVLINTEGDCNLQGDRLHLMSVVFNLLDNALKYSKENPLIKISLEEKENNIEMKVADNGIGIPAEYQSKVFDKFFRVPHGDTHNAKGYGLGLSYVAHVVAKHKGTIAVESNPGEGTTFTISLPKKS